MPTPKPEPTLLERLAAEKRATRPEHRVDAAQSTAILAASTPTRAPSKRPAKRAKPVEAECDELTAFRWVMANINNDVEPKHAPSRAAWNLLASARADADLQQELWKRFAALGAKQDDNTGDRLGQTGRFCQKLLNDLIAFTRDEMVADRA